MLSRAITTIPVRVSPRANHQPDQTKPVYPLNEKIVRLARKGAWLRLRDIVRNIQIFGSIGSGKTSCVFLTLFRCLCAAWHAAIYLCAKPDSAAKAIEIAEYAGRLESIRVMRHGGEWHINPIEWAIEWARRKGVMLPLREALDELLTIIEILHRGQVSKEGDNFFLPAQEELLHKIMKVLLLATGRCRIEEIVRCARMLPDRPDAFVERDRYPIVGHLETIVAKHGGTQEINDLIEYFEQLAAMSDKTRTSIIVSLTVRMAPMLEEPIYSAFFKHSTNLTPEMIDRERLILIVDYPVSIYGGAGRCIGAALKQMCQKYCMNRPQDDNSVTPFGFWQDEAACWLTDRIDPEAAERGRSGRMYHVNTYQAVSTVINGYGGGAVGESRAKALMANFNICMFCAQTCHETRERAEKMVGKILRWIPQIGESTTPGMHGGLGSSRSYSPQWWPSLPEEWLMGLATGEKDYAETYVIKAGEKFRINQKRYLLVRWYRPLGDPWMWGSHFFERHPTARPWVCSVDVKRFWRLWRKKGFWKAVERWADFWPYAMRYPEARYSRRGDNV